VSVKLAAFYGLLTWLLLRIAGVHFVYLPTLGAMVFSAIPAIPPIVVLIPGLLELIFGGAWFRAILLFSAFVYSGVADEIIVNEVSPELVLDRVGWTSER